MNTCACMYTFVNSMWVWAAQNQKHDVRNKDDMNHINQHRVHPRSMDITGQGHRRELNQGQSKVVLLFSRQHPLPKRSGIH